MRRSKINHNNIMSHHIIQLTSFLLLCPIYLCEPNDVLDIALFATFICSQMFWSDPKRGSLVHNIDAFVAKLTFALFVWSIDPVYWTYRIALMLCFLLFYLSHVNSSINWCSDKHVMCHALAHASCAYAITFAY